MATVEETYKIALENRNALNSIKDKAKKTEDFTPLAAQDTDLIRISRSGSSAYSTVGDIRSLSGAGEDNVQADWSVNNDQNDAYIRNKPENLSDFNDDINAGGSGGDMEKADYDTTNTGNSVDRARTLNGYTEQDFVLKTNRYIDLDRRWSKYPGNTNPTTPEINDMLVNFWWSTSLFIKQAQYNGGNITLLGNYTILDSIEY